MNHYELVIIFDPVLSPEELKDEIAAYQGIITAEGGSIVHEERWGLKTLAYPIKRKTTGIYYLCEFAAEGPVIQKLETQFGRDDRIIRQLLTRLDKYGIEYAERRRQRLARPKDEPKEEVKRESKKPVEATVSENAGTTEPQS
jgi:small subunit ribosomal protein S6